MHSGRRLARLQAHLTPFRLPPPRTSASMSAEEATAAAGLGKQDAAGVPATIAETIPLLAVPDKTFTIEELNKFNGEKGEFLRAARECDVRYSFSPILTQ